MNTSFDDLSCFDIDEYEEICLNKQQETNAMNEPTEEKEPCVEMQTEFPTIEKFLKETKWNLLHGIMNLFPGIAIRKHDHKTAVKLGECFGFMRALYGAGKKHEAEVLAKSFAVSFRLAACDLEENPVTRLPKVPKQILLIEDDETTMGFSFVFMHLAKKEKSSIHMIRPFDKYSSLWDAPYTKSLDGVILFHGLVDVFDSQLGQSYGWGMQF